MDQAPNHGTPAGASQEAIRAHYDVGAEFFKLWLDECLVYSAARLCDPFEVPPQDLTLGRAQENKLDFHLEAMRAGNASCILDIGCGWGALLDRAVERFGVDNAIGLTFSDSQHAYLRSKSADGVTVHLQSYETFEPDQSIDRIVCIGAFEHFVQPQTDAAARWRTYERFFALCFNLLAPRGRLSLQTICWGNVSRGRALTLLPVDYFPESDVSLSMGSAWRVERSL